MDESNWWLYLIGAAVAYYFVPWGAVLKWLAVAICVGIAFAFFTDNSHSAQYRLIGGLFFSVVAVLTARSKYRETDDALPTKGSRKKVAEPYREPCPHCTSGKVRCMHLLSNDRDARGYSCPECYGTHFKKCYSCGGTGKR